jgi:topoisomerase-4 subunit B
MGSSRDAVSANFINDFVKTKLDNYLHKNTATADALLRKILQAERGERIVRHSKISQRQG